MYELIKKLREKAHIAISVPTVMCFVTFITNIFKALSDGNIDGAEFHALLASADGFETIVLLSVMLVLKQKQK